jgi:hypothetical protein
VNRRSDVKLETKTKAAFGPIDLVITGIKKNYQRSRKKIRSIRLLKNGPPVRDFVLRFETTKLGFSVQFEGVSTQNYGDKPHQRSFTIAGSLYSSG